eukprot:scaffold5373_cov103-Isochrysis_galbana.AAC.3
MVEQHDRVRGEENDWPERDREHGRPVLGRHPCNHGLVLWHQPTIVAQHHHHAPSLGARRGRREAAPRRRVRARRPHDRGEAGADVLDGFALRVHHQDCRSARPASQRGAKRIFHSPVCAQQAALLRRRVARLVDDPSAGALTGGDAARLAPGVARATTARPATRANDGHDGCTVLHAVGVVHWLHGALELAGDGEVVRPQLTDAAAPNLHGRAGCRADKARHAVESPPQRGTPEGYGKWGRGRKKRSEPWAAMYEELHVA